jgi:hypothetical protein
VGGFARAGQASVCYSSSWTQPHVCPLDAWVWSPTPTRPIIPRTFPPMTFGSILHFFQLRPLSFLLRCTHHAACGRQVAHDEEALPTAVGVTRLNENAHTHTLVSLRAHPLQVLSARQHGKCLWKPVQGASPPHPPFPVPARTPQPQHPRTNHTLLGPWHAAKCNPFSVFFLTTMNGVTAAFGDTHALAADGAVHSRSVCDVCLNTTDKMPLLSANLC